MARPTASETTPRHRRQISREPGHRLRDSVGIGDAFPGPKKNQAQIAPGSVIAIVPPVVRHVRLGEVCPWTGLTHELLSHLRQTGYSTAAGEVLLPPFEGWWPTEDGNCASEVLIDLPDLVNYLQKCKTLATQRRAAGRAVAARSVSSPSPTPQPPPSAATISPASRVAPEDRKVLTPLRYPGGKSRLGGFVKRLMDQNDLHGGHYAEPYAGGAGVAMLLLVSGHAAYVHLNDLDRGVYAFWKGVFRNPDDLCGRILGARLDLAEWERQRAIYQDPGQHTDEELAFAFFYLNRTNRSGILSGSLIGGHAQTGKWNMASRFNAVNLIFKIEVLAAHGHKVSLHNLDALQFLREVVSPLPSKALIYLDPPYCAIKHRLYQDIYRRGDHLLLAQAIRALSHPWLASYNDIPQITGLYSDFRQMRYDLDYSAHSKRAGKEVLLFSGNLQVPEATSPLESGDYWNFPEAAPSKV